MAGLEDGLWLKEFVDPQLLEDFKNYKDDFIGTFKAPNAAAIDTDGIKFNKLNNSVGFKINTDSDFTAQKITGKKRLIDWDRLDTTPTELSEDEARAMAFDREAEYRVLHANAWKMGVRNYAMYKAAPLAKTVDTPIIRTTGADDGTGRKRMTYIDLINLYNSVLGMNLTNQEELYMVLSAEHSQDLIADRANTNNYRDIVIDPVTGAIQRFFKLKFFENNHSVKYTAANTLVGLDATPLATDMNASIFYYAPNIVHHVEAVQTLYKPMIQDTKSKIPKSEMRLHSWGLTEKKQEMASAAIVSTKI
ncbi:hypothetical protein [Algoriella sp.]|uniref:hypothetical protein n=1 Tax=Algoriella sp. TaxID=1872434 RepID=UPI002FC72FB3